jgi:hypothetical protein
VPPANSLPPELLEALDTVRERISGLRWDAWPGSPIESSRLLYELEEAERELDHLRELLLKAKRLAAPHSRAATPRRRRRAS